MRIADNMNFNQVKDSLGRNRTEMSDLHNQAATMKKITKPSDDPVGASRLLVVRSELQGNEQFMKNQNLVRSFLDYSEQSLADLNEIFVRAKELAIGQSSGASANELSRKMVAREVSELFKQAVNLGNRKFADKFLFGGFKTLEAPFDPQGNYSGDSGQSEIEVNNGVFVASNLPGSVVFLGEDLYEKPGMRDRHKEREKDYGPVQNIELRTEEHDGDFESGGRGPASKKEESIKKERTDQAGHVITGLNVFKVLKNLEIGLETNDTAAIQNTLNDLDTAASQVTTARAEIGSRVATLNNINEALQKAKVDSKTLISSIEDADAFETYSDLNRTETNLKATLSTSGRLIQPSLLDFLK